MSLKDEWTKKVKASEGGVETMAFLIEKLDGAGGVPPRPNYVRPNQLFWLSPWERRNLASVLIVTTEGREFIIDYVDPDKLRERSGFREAYSQERTTYPDVVMTFIETYFAMAHPPSIEPPKESDEEFKKRLAPMMAVMAQDQRDAQAQFDPDIRIEVKDVIPVSRPAPKEFVGKPDAVLDFVDRSNCRPPLLFPEDLTRCPKHPDQICRLVSMTTDCPRCR